MNKYITIWFMSATQEYQRLISTKTSALFFFIGKVFRFSSFFLLLLLLRQQTKVISGYTMDEVIVFFLTFNLIDISAQMFFRGVYQVSGKIRTGELDGYMTKPVNVLFRLLTGLPDLNDFLIFIPLICFTVYYFIKLHILFDFDTTALYIAFLINGFLLAMAFHILVICFGIITTEVDNTIMLYRDISQMGRFPVSIYRQPLQFFITFIVPVGIMMNIPAMILTRHVSYVLLFLCSILSIVFLNISFRVWKFAIKKYTSASS